MINIDGLEYTFGRRLPAGAESCTQLLLLRILMGKAIIRKGQHSVRQRANYSLLPCAPQTLSWTEALEQLNVNYSSNLRSASFVRKALSDNRIFFRDVLNEFSHYFIQTSKGSHVSAFVCLYRVLERFTYSVPLLYCSTQHDFSKTFDDLKNMFSTKNVGEIGLFNKFLRVGGLIDRTVLDSVCYINFVSVSGLESKFYSAADKSYPHCDVKDPTRASLGLAFGDIGKLLVAVRNRFFHLSTGGWQDNVSMTEIWDADEYFENLNGTFCNFLAIVLVSVIIHKYSA